MYTIDDYKTKKQLIADFNAGKKIAVYQPGPFGGDPEKINGEAVIEMPKYPLPHRSYCQVTVENGIIVKVKK